MSDMMTFPDTVEEFMENYKIVDSEQIYTNGTEMIPIFRMKQWFEHLPSAQPEIIRCRECRHSYVFEPWFSRDEMRCCRWWGQECDMDSDLIVEDDDFCSHAERRE